MWQLHCLSVFIKGTATNSQSGEKLPRVNILLVKASRGAAAISDGTFEIDNVLQENYTIYISYIGLVHFEQKLP